MFRAHRLIRNVTVIRRCRQALHVQFLSTTTSADPIPPLEYQPEIRLRGYQEECIQSVLKYLKDGHRRLGISLATGSGKTVIFTQLINRIPPPNDTATQTLILAHRRELVEQAASHCAKAYPDKTIDIELGNCRASGVADITVASVQSLMSKGRIKNYDPARFKLLLVDEAHHIVARQYLDILEYFGLKPQQDNAPALVGVSATFSRFDGLKLGVAIDHIVYHRDYVDMINEKWLSDVIFTTVRMKKTNLEKVATGANGDFLTSALSEAVNTPENNEMAVRSWLSRCALRRSTLAFCVDIKHVVDLAAAFQACGIESRIVTGDTPKQVRGATVDAFRRGEFPVLLNCGVFTEGTDIPNIDCILLARPTKSRNLLVQMIGRGMRLHAAKTNCHVIDMVSSLKTGIVTTPTLYGLDPDELVESARVEDLQNLKDRQERAKLAIQELQTAKTVAPAMLQGESSKMISFVDYDSINDLIEDTSGERHIRAISPHAWVQVNEDDYVLTTSFGNVLRITKDDHYRVKYTAKLPASEQKKSPYARPRMIIEKALTFEDAIHGADSFAEQVFPFVFIDKNQRWRRDDATAAQLDYLNKFRPEDKQLDTCSITKGRAVDMITKLKFGARGRFDRIEASHARAKKQDSTMRKMEEMKSREQVRVGPLEP